MCFGVLTTTVVCKMRVSWLAFAEEFVEDWVFSVCVCTTQSEFLLFNIIGSFLN